jgi:hypothetical protein
MFTATAQTQEPNLLLSFNVSIFKNALVSVSCVASLANSVSVKIEAAVL